MSLESPAAFRAPQPAALPEYTTATMERFQCLAERCEDTCCRDWAVPIGREDLDRMKSAMSSTAEGREHLVRLVVIGNQGRAHGGLAQLQMTDEGACPMLESDNRCGVHGAFGEQALTTPCSIFPRTALAVDAHLEVGGSLGCPEVARLTLLPSESARLRPATKAMLPRSYVGKIIAQDATNAYTASFANVRQNLLDCFDHPLALGTRFVVAAELAERVRPFFYAATAAFQGARRTFAENQLQAELQQTHAPRMHALLQQDLDGLRATGEPVTGVVASLLRERQRLPHSARFARLVEEVFVSLSSTNEAAAAAWPQIWRAYAARRSAVEARVGTRLRRIFSSYCQHFLMRNPYTDAATLPGYMYGLGMNLAAVLFLTIGHPDLAAQLSAPPNQSEDARVLDGVAVHAIQTFTKAITHHPEFLQATIIRKSDDPVGVSFGQLVLIAKFVG